jgi:hypothetical protein
VGGILKLKLCLASVAHAWNPSYLGGWDWEDLSSRQAQEGSLWGPTSANSWVWWCIPVIPAAVGSIKQED